MAFQAGSYRPDWPLGCSRSSRALPHRPGSTCWLIVGAILAPGRRTVAAALRVIGLDRDPHFTNYHRVLNRNQWSSRWLARCLLRLLIATFVPTGPVIVGL